MPCIQICYILVSNWCIWYIFKIFLVPSKRTKRQRCTLALSKKELSVAIYLDFSKAFDTVNHQILLKKLEAYGITNTGLNFFKTYLDSRSQVVKYNDTISPIPQVVKHGVPQGSLLGPLLFSLYINDLHLSDPSGTFYQYADDTAIIYTANDAQALQTMIDNSLPKITAWLTCNRLTINAKKTTYQLFSTQTNHPNLSIKINNHSIERQAKTKYLGIVIDDKFKWDCHIRNVENTISRNIGFISRARKFLKPDHLQMLYHSLIQSHFVYGIQIWGQTYPSRLERLKILQKKAVRIIDSADRLAPSSPIFRKYSIIKLHDLVKLFHMYVLNAFLNNSLPRPLADKFLLAPQTRVRAVRHPRHFEVPFAPYMYRSFSLFLSAPKIWNTCLATKIRDIDDIPHSKAVFKKVVKKIFLDAY